MQLKRMLPASLCKFDCKVGFNFFVKIVGIADRTTDWTIDQRDYMEKVCVVEILQQIDRRS